MKKVICISIDKDLNKLLNLKSKNEYRSKSAIVSMAIEKYFGNKKI